MKILLVVDQMSVGGVENWLITVAKGLLALGHAPVAFSMSRSGALMNRLEETGVKVRSITNNVKDLGFFKPAMIRAFRKVVVEETPDIVHTCDVISGHIGRLACIGLSVPTVHHLRNVVPHKKMKYRVVASLLSFFTSHYITVSQAVADLVLANENCASRPNKVLFNCIDTDRIDSASPVSLDTLLSKETGRPILVFCGRLAPQKNVHLLIEAVALVRKSLPDVQFLILGDGPERGKLEQLVVELGLLDNVAFTGFRNDVVGILKSLAGETAILGMPSDYEGFSNALSEALYSGVPAIISRHVPNQEMTGSAAIVCARDAKEIAAIMLEVMASPERYVEMQKSAIDKGASLTLEAYLDKLINEVYEPLVS